MCWNVKELSNVYQNTISIVEYTQYSPLSSNRDFLLCHLNYVSSVFFF